MLKSHRNVVCLLKYPSSKLHKDVVDWIFQLLYNICIRVFLWCIRVALNKVCDWTAKDNILETTVPFLWKKKTLVNIPRTLDFSLSWGITGWRVEKSKEFYTLRKHAYSNILKMSSPNTESLQSLLSAQNIDCGHLLEPPRRGATLRMRLNVRLAFCAIEVK